MRRVVFFSWLLASAGFSAAFATISLSAVAVADEAPLDRAKWMGVKVLPKLDAEVKADDGVVFDEKKRSLPLVVQDVKGDLLLVGDHDKGWVVQPGRHARRSHGLLHIAYRAGREAGLGLRPSSGCMGPARQV